MREFWLRMKQVLFDRKVQCFARVFRPAWPRFNELQRTELWQCICNEWHRQWTSIQGISWPVNVVVELNVAKWFTLMVTFCNGGPLSPQFLCHLLWEISYLFKLSWNKRESNHLARAVTRKPVLFSVVFHFYILDSSASNFEWSLEGCCRVCQTGDNSSLALQSSSDKSTSLRILHCLWLNDLKMFFLQAVTWL